MRYYGIVLQMELFVERVASSTPQITHIANQKKKNYPYISLLEEGTKRTLD